MLRTVSITATATLALMLAGCGKKAETTTSSIENSTSATMEAGGNMASNAMSGVENAVTPTMSAQEFADTAAKTDAFEIAAANLALKNGASKDVKDFAAKMVKDHTESTAKIKKAAAAALPAITPDPTLTSDQQDKLDDLAKLAGADFDKKYASEQVDAHEKALSMLQDYAKNGDVASLKTTAMEIVPVVQHHLDMAKALEK